MICGLIILVVLLSSLAVTVSGDLLKGNVKYAYVGDDVSLDCPFKLGSKPNLIRWTFMKEDDDIIVKTYKNGEVMTELDGQIFCNRTELFVNKTGSGNACLTVKQVKITDSGRYLCRVTNGKLSEVTVELHVSEKPTAKPEEKSLNDNSKDATGVDTTCAVIVVVAVTASVLALVIIFIWIVKTRRKKCGHLPQQEHNIDVSSEQKTPFVSSDIKDEVFEESEDSAYSSHNNSTKDLNKLA